MPSDAPATPVPSGSRSGDFTHLHLHTLYSLLDGAIRVGDLIKNVTAKGMKSVAVTDHGNMFGTIDFYQKAKAAGIKPIIGTEAYVAGPKGMEDRSERVGHHLILLAKNKTGYSNLRYLASMAYLKGFYYDPRVDKRILKDHSEGLIALSACLGGEVPRAVKRGDNDGARKAALEYKEIFEPGSFYLEVQSNGLPEQIQVNDVLKQMSVDLDIPLVATADSHYVSREDARAHEHLMCIASGKTLEDQRRLRHETDELYIKSPEEMFAAFGDFQEAVTNTQRIAEQCNVELDLKSTYLPKFKTPDGMSLEDFLRVKARSGLQRRFDELTYKVDQDAYRERLERELGVIIQMKFPGYFLIVHDFIDWAKEHGIPVGPGRGSGAGSIAAWSLRITDIDPIRYNLLFERFLNPERVSMPDFDIDFCQEKRGEVINYVTDKYGKDNVGQIITFGSLKAKSVIRDVCRVKGLPYADGDRIAKLVPEVLNITLKEAIEQEPRLRALMDENQTYREVIEIALRLEGLHRQAGMHAAGVVIAEEPLWNYVPLYRGQNGELVTQFAKDEVEKAGLVKFDFLGLKTLTVIANAVKMINRSLPPAEQVEIARIPVDDRKTYELITRGETAGVFQMESSGFTEMVKKLKPSCFEDIIAAGALYRPGPLDAGMVDRFIDRKHGREKVAYPHPSLEAILKETYGVIVYQEQVMQISQVLSGYSLGRADLLRRAMGKKKADVMAKERSGFLEGAVKNNVAEAVASEIFDTMEKFAEYGFNKSHSAAYGLVTIQTAWLKAHYPSEFMAALLSSERDNTDKVVLHIAEAREMGIRVLQPDINESELDFNVPLDAVATPAAPGRKKQEKPVRFGLGAIKGVGQAAVEAILPARVENGKHKPFLGLFDFCQRVDLKRVNKKVIEALICAGAFDFTRKPRRALIEALDGAVERGQSSQRDKASGQSSLFGLLGGGPKGAPSQVSEDVPGVEEWQERERLKREKQALGFYITGHPLDRYADDLAQKRWTTHNVIGLREARPFDKVQVAGIVYGWRERPTRTGKRLGFVTLEDFSGTIECVAYDEAVAKFSELLTGDDPLLIKGRVRLNERMGGGGAGGGGEEGGGEVKATPELQIEDVQLLARVRAERATRVEIRVDAETCDEDRLKRLATLLKVNPGNCAPYLFISVPGQAETRLALKNGKIAPGDELLSNIDRLFGGGRHTSVR
jgi:DNA polymerase-3 subunit alpha